MKIFCGVIRPKSMPSGAEFAQGQRDFERGLRGGEEAATSEDAQNFMFWMGVASRGGPKEAGRFLDMVGKLQASPRRSEEG